MSEALELRAGIAFIRVFSFVSFVILEYLLLLFFSQTEEPDSIISDDT